jgi:hypothetical protein
MAAKIKTILNIIKIVDYKAQHAAEKSKRKKYLKESGQVSMHTKRC